LDDIPFAKKKSTNKPNFGVSKFQKVFRDFAFILDSNIRGEELIFAALKVDQNIIKDVDIFDIFEDSSLGNNKKSMAIKVTMQADDRTLSESEIQDLSSKIIIAIETSTSGSVRS
jgi:phenylalanyl-tRNA synthetase beta chain